MRDWLGQQTREFGNAGFGRESNAMVDCDDAKEKSEDGSNRGVEHVRAIKKKVRTELNPTMTNAFRTEDGAAAWTPSVVKELMTLPWTQASQKRQQKQLRQAVLGQQLKYQRTSESGQQKPQAREVEASAEE